MMEACSRKAGSHQLGMPGKVASHGWLNLSPQWKPCGRKGGILVLCTLTFSAYMKDADTSI